MGLSLSHPLDREEFYKHPGRQFISGDTLKILPERWKVKPGSLVTSFKAHPSGIRFLNPVPDNLFWWPDVKFLPHSESSLVVSVGAYLNRANHSPRIAFQPTHGTLYTMALGEENLRCRRFGGRTFSWTRCIPNVATHPSGRIVTSASFKRIFVVDIEASCEKDSSDTWVDNESRHNNFSYTTFTPNGKYVASMARCSRHIELETFRLVNHHLSRQYCLDCHRVCKEFQTDMHNPGKFECKFSPDSEYIACALSHGQLFVVKRYELKLHCNIIPGMFDISQTKLASEKTFDFDPRFLNRFLAFCDCKGRLFISDIQNLQPIASERHISTTLEIHCLKYCPTGRNLAVALSDATVQLLDTDSLDTLHILDNTLLDPDSRMNPDENGVYAKIIQISFASTGNLMVTSATDGIVRMWQLWPDLSLLQLCKRQILQHVNLSDVFKLPIPSRLITLLLDWPEL